VTLVHSAFVYIFSALNQFFFGLGCLGWDAEVAIPSLFFSVWAV